jgi:hypothetical protein
MPAIAGRITRGIVPPMASIRIGLGIASLLVCACSSTSNGTFAVEARGAIAIESAGAVAAGALAGAGGHNPGGNIDVDFLGYGVGAAINTTVVDVVGGFDQRRFDDDYVPELSVGLRKRFGVKESPVYVFALARSDRSDTLGEVGFNGSAVGLGLLVQITPRVFVDLSGAYERTGNLAVDPARSRYEQGVFRFGLGFSF